MAHTFYFLNLHHYTDITGQGGDLPKAIEENPDIRRVLWHLSLAKKYSATKTAKIPSIHDILWQTETRVLRKLNSASYIIQLHYQLYHRVNKRE